jgi:peptidylprolyl isomerase
MIAKLTMVALIATSAACSASEPVSDAPATETQPAEETVAVSSTEEPDAPAEEPSLPPPPNVEAAPPNAEASPSGLAWIVVESGAGGLGEAGATEESPTIESTIKVHYTGWTTDGKMFDSSVVRNEPIEFPLNKLIPGWQEGIPMMKRGEKRRFWIPEDLAYGKSTRADAPKGLLVFDIELIDFR